MSVEQKLAWPSFTQPRTNPERVQSPVVWKLPPLILHPFTGEKGSDQLLEGTRAQLALNGLLPGYHGDRETMEKAVLDGLYQELKMLVYIGRDLQRWADQCLDFVTREPKLRAENITEQSFLTLLVESPPAGFAVKLKSWGITDQRAIFSRAAGLNSVFDHPPLMKTVNSNFLKNYQRFADHFFTCSQSMTTFRRFEKGQFIFELYASEEYARLLEEGWRS